ncbi:glycosyltransferase family 2 protein [Pseudohalioglobus sediminis]|uniref:Glycosyltransferase family 2 protein n=1 Tax=Pseudohalioglobus sediminis TaxID=2606449 RepID=A0A5B0WUG7_9GAMM|nr:glycosyltransferase family A protein [Pseudohalioglobus sediminis]KAA1190067.1 glycosyltransferase family 2 protein [Pseudohalioglobus sediminis]
MKLSVVVVAYDMQREIPRTLQSLTRDYQTDCADLEYEVLVMDNGSPQPMDAGAITAFGDNFHYHYLPSPPPSPAMAMNHGARLARGDILCFMIDGAHLLTPGVFKHALASFRAFGDAIVLTRYFFLGPGDQNDTIADGYCREEEDRLLQSIDWPQQGYRLFEIGTPLQGDVPKITWFNKMTESNCLFMLKSTFADIGGADERFDLPGGGFVNLDLYKRAADHPGTEPVLLIGEGSFHQLHGGTTTNVAPEERDREVARYKAQYREIHGQDLVLSDKPVHFLGHLPTLHSKIHMRNNARSHTPPTPELLESVRQTSPVASANAAKATGES